MKKHELKSGMIVECRDGRRRMVFKWSDRFILSGYDGYIYSNYYGDDLLDKDGDSVLDIVKVWRVVNFLPRDINNDLGFPLWTREPVIKLLIDGKDIVLSEETEEGIRVSLKGQSK